MDLSELYIVTDECRVAFESWFGISNEEYDSENVTKKREVDILYHSSIMQKSGVFFDFFDSVGIEVYIMPVFREKCGYDSFKRDGWTYEIITAEPCQMLMWSDFNQCAEEIDEENEEFEPDERCLKPSVPTRKEAIAIALKEANKMFNNKK